jgi:hypothetical protein
MHFIRTAIAPIVASLFLLPACGPQHKKAQLKALDTAKAYQTKNNITVNAQHLSRAQIHDTFGSRGRKLGYYSLCPIQLHIQNKSDAVVIFDPTKTTIEYANHADVAYCLQNNTVRNTTGLVGLGLLATGAICLYTLPFALWYYATGITTTLLYVGCGAATGMLILTPTVAVYYAKKASTANRATERDIKEVAVTHTRTIPAGQELDVILFTKKENCKKDFAITLINEATQEPTVFNITL